MKQIHWNMNSNAWLVICAILKTQIKPMVDVMEFKGELLEAQQLVLF